MIFRVKKKIKGLIAEARHVAGRRSALPGGVRVLMYHSIGGNPDDHPIAVRVPETNFERQLDLLNKNGYKTITVSDYIMKNFSPAAAKIIVITFDDGYKDNFTFAASELKRFGMKATFFVTTSYITGDVKKYWRGGKNREYMRWEDVRSLSDAGFEIGSHMLHHIKLAELSDADMARELKESKDIIASHIEKNVNVFSYPYGSVSQKVIAAAKQAGYIGGCSSYKGVNYGNNDIYTLKRTEIDGYDIISNFKSKLEGWYD